MKRVIVWVVGLIFLMCTSAFAVDNPATAPAGPEKGAPVKMEQKKEVKKVKKAIKHKKAKKAVKKEVKEEMPAPAPAK